MKTSLFHTAAAALAALLACAPAAAVAGQGHDAARVRVAHQDLDLTAEAGARVLLQRLQTAAGVACRRDEGPRVSRDQTDCRRAAVAGAVRRADAPALTALYEDAAPDLVLASR